ncbi:hypothetical protein ADK55_33140 [Streptomyces sp. WM4235]|nr:hypothetical protein ADK55_33140 [Streptomyces sp. WM4235]
MGRGRTAGDCRAVMRAAVMRAARPLFKMGDVVDRPGAGFVPRRGPTRIVRPSTGIRSKARAGPTWAVRPAPDAPG